MTPTQLRAISQYALLVSCMFCALLAVQISADSSSSSWPRKKHKSPYVIGGDRDEGSAYRYRNGFDKTNAKGARVYEHNAGYGFAEEIDNRNPNPAKTVWGRKYATAQTSTWGKITPRVWRLPSHNYNDLSYGWQELAIVNNKNNNNNNNKSRRRKSKSHHKAHPSPVWNEIDNNNNINAQQEQQQASSSSSSPSDPDVERAWRQAVQQHNQQEQQDPQQQQQQQQPEQPEQPAQQPQVQVYHTSSSVDEQQQQQPYRTATSSEKVYQYRLNDNNGNHRRRHHRRQKSNRRQYRKHRHQSHQQRRRPERQQQQQQQQPYESDQNSILAT